MLMNGTFTLRCSSSWKLCAVTHGVPMAQTPSDSSFFAMSIIGGTGEGFEWSRM